tara:strand:+ start:104 stop:541 length:438 start_codon:yes stop_codon:yes gene_type:complete
MLLIRNTLFFIFVIIASFNIKAEESHYQIFKEVVKLSSSLDAYSSICVMNFNKEKVQSDLFGFINLAKKLKLIDDNELRILKEDYFKVFIATDSQLNKLRLNKNKRLCREYLKMFDRIDERKIKQLIMIQAITDEIKYKSKNFDD